MSDTKLITLQVGERRFTTSESTLKDGSSFFQSKLERWQNDAQEDGSLFVDVDPDVFQHVLRYLRSGVFPLFYHNTKGFDHNLYNLLAQQADYFQISRLHQWISDKSYLQAIKIIYTTILSDDALALATRHTADLGVEYHPSWKTEKVVKQGDDPILYEDEQVLQMVQVGKKVVFDASVCMGGGDE
ncbi:hypothetical protein P7C71_g6327, partial [Lecanoromycetidae sp. Uapishka_2]